MGASVRQRLLNYAKANNRPFAEVLQYYAMERFLYRLSASPHASKFLLKGALLLTAWRAPMSRPTMDIDLLIFEGESSNESKLLLPHPRIRERGFVLVPLFELYPSGNALGYEFLDSFSMVEKNGIIKYTSTN